MTLPKVSVVVITYGHEKYILETLRGVFLQEYPGDIELIVSNDNSPDNTEEVINDFLLKTTIPNHVTFRYIKHEENIGMMPNFISSMMLATGDYIALCEGDDYWIDPMKLQDQICFLENNKDYVLSFHRCKFLDGDVAYDQAVDHVNYDYTIYNLLTKWGIATASLVFRNVLTIGDFPSWSNQAKSGDILLVCLLFERGKFKYINDKVMSVYRLGVGVSTSHVDYNMIDYRAFLYYNLNHFFKLRYQNEIYDALNEIYLNFSGANKPEVYLKRVGIKGLLKELGARIFKWR